MPGGRRGPAARSWLGVAWGPLSPVGLSRSPLVLPSIDAISMMVGPKVHTPAAGVVPSMEPRSCGLETSLASRRVSHTHFSETRVDGLEVPVIIQSASRPVLTLSASSLGLSASVVLASLPSSLALALFVTEPLAPHTQTPSVVLDMPLIAEAGLSGMEAVAQMVLSTWLTGSATTAPVVPGVRLLFAEAVLLLIPGVEPTLSHPASCLPIV